MGASAIYQRTDLGRIEIQQKRQGLTQSERLVLIVVDGRATLSELSEKLMVLDAARIVRAIERLASKHLIYEVLLPTAVLKPELYDSAVIDRFLQQDPLDPVTIVSFDADYEYDEVLGGPIAGLSSGSTTKCDSSMSLVVEDAFVKPGSFSVDFFIPLKKEATISSAVDRGLIGFLFISSTGCFEYIWRKLRPLQKLFQSFTFLFSWGVLLVAGFTLLLLSIYGKIL